MRRERGAEEEDEARIFVDSIQCVYQVRTGRRRKRKRI